MALVVCPGGGKIRLMQPETLAEQLYFVTVPIWGANDDGSWTGTGFLLSVPINGGDVQLPVLITNKHLVAEPEKMEVGIHLANEQGQWTPGLGVRVNMGTMGAQQKAIHPDESVDVAVFAFGPIVNGTYDGRRPFFKTFAVENLMLDHDLESLDALEDVLFVGYPAGISDEANNTPIVRRGMAATPLTLNYSGEPAFLIDAAVHPGSSGSPVLLWNQGSYRTREGDLVVGSRFGLLGILAAVHTDEIVGEFVAMPAEQRPVIRQPVGLGIVYRSGAIMETVNLLCQDLGVEIWESEEET